MTHYAETRKIDPSRAPRLRPDGTPDDNDRVEIGPTALAFAEWAALGLEAPDLAAMRRWRLERLTGELAARDIGALLITDPLNIRYATDSTNMQLWNAHNPFRACLVCADGHVVLWDYKNSPFLAGFNPLVREVRSGASLFYFARGACAGDAATAFAAEIAALMAERVGANRRIAVDKMMRVGLLALDAVGLTVLDGEVVTEHARSIKGPDEIRAMRCALASCEAAVAAMRAAARPGLSEDDIWAVLHAENIRRGGEWIETRLLASGPRTNPWFQECGPRVLRDNEILAFDTDLIGPYGMCADISRTWWIGAEPPRDDMVADYRLGMEHIAHNMALLRPGLRFDELTWRAHVLPPDYQKQKYACLAHGVGLCDEWPHIDYPDGLVPGAFEGELQPGMTLCVEALVSREGADFSIKLEEQVLITGDGCENLTRCPHDPALMGA